MLRVHGNRSMEGEGFSYAVVNDNYFSPPTTTTLPHGLIVVSGAVFTLKSSSWLWACGKPAGFSKRWRQPVGLSRGLWAGAKQPSIGTR